MPTTPHSPLGLHGPGELIAAIPALLGFRPTDSVIVVTYAGDTEHRLLTTVLRSDIPDPAAVGSWVDQDSVVCERFDGAEYQIMIRPKPR